MAGDQRNALWPFCLLTLAVLFWSGNFVVGRYIRGAVTPITLNFWRWAGALIILLPLGAPRLIRQAVLVRKEWKSVALLSIPSISIFNTFIYTALRSSSAINTVLLNALTPIVIAFMARMFFKEPLRKRQIAGIVISLAGLVTLITQADWHILIQMKPGGGDLWTLTAVCAWAIYSILIWKRPSQLDPIAFLTLLATFGLLFLLPFYLAEHHLKGPLVFAGPLPAAMTYIALFPSVLAYLFWNRGVLAVGPNRAGIFFHLMPPFAIVMAIIFLGETLQLFHLVGLLLIFAGIALTTLPPPGQAALGGKG